MAQPSLLSIVSCSAQCHLLSAVFLGPCYLLPSVSPAAHFRSLHPAPLSPQREHQLIPVPRTESGRWQALSTLLGVRVVGEASVSHLERGSPLLWSSGSLTRLSPTRSVALVIPLPKKPPLTPRRRPPSATMTSPLACRQDTRVNRTLDRG